MSWFKRKPEEPTSVEVGTAHIHIVANDARSFDVRLDGYCVQRHRWIFTYTSKELFEAWQLRVGQTGMVDCGNGNYIPLCNVSDISVEHKSHKVVMEISK
jgi:hypothetical protein